MLRSRKPTRNNEERGGGSSSFIGPGGPLKKAGTSLSFWRIFEKGRLFLAEPHLFPLFLPNLCPFLLKKPLFLPLFRIMLIPCPLNLQLHLSHSSYPQISFFWFPGHIFTCPSPRKHVFLPNFAPISSL